MAAHLEHKSPHTTFCRLTGRLVAKVTVLITFEFISHLFSTQPLATCLLSRLSAAGAASFQIAAVSEFFRWRPPFNSDDERKKKLSLRQFAALICCWAEPVPFFAVKTVNRELGSTSSLTLAHPLHMTSEWQAESFHFSAVASRQTSRSAVMKPVSIPAASLGQL